MPLANERQLSQENNMPLANERQLLQENNMPPANERQLVERGGCKHDSSSSKIAVLNFKCGSQ
jgi:hypothetical protein